MIAKTGNDVVRRQRSTSEGMKDEGRSIVHACYVLIA